MAYGLDECAILFSDVSEVVETLCQHSTYVSGCCGRCSCKVLSLFKCVEPTVCFAGLLFRDFYFLYVELFCFLKHVYKVVWEHIKEHWLLFTKGQKVSLGKYHQTTYNSLRTNHLHSLKGFFFAVACVKLGCWSLAGKDAGAASKAKASGSAASSSGAAASAAVQIEGKATLKQENCVQAGDFHVNQTNQLERAAKFFGDISNLHTFNRCSFVLEGLANFHSTQTRDLRNPDNAIPFELDFMSGGTNRIILKTLKNLSEVEKFESFGISTSWVACDNINLFDLEVVDADENARCLWNITLTAILELVKRNLTFTVGLPRRRTLLLHEKESVREDFVKSVRLDLDLFKKLQAHNKPWSKAIVKASPCQTRPVQQLHMCLADDNWIISPRISNYSYGGSLICSTIGIITFRVTQIVVVSAYSSYNGGLGIY